MEVDVGVEVDRIDEAMVREALGEGGDGLADLVDAIAEVLAAVAGDENEGHPSQSSPTSSPSSRLIPARSCSRLRWAATSREEGIDHRVAGHVDSASGIPPVSRAVRAVSVGAKWSAISGRGQPPVHLLGEGRPDVPRAEPGLHVPDGDAPVETGQGGDQVRWWCRPAPGPGRAGAVPSHPSMPSIRRAVSPASVWSGRITSRSASTWKPNVSATCPNISLC